MSTPSIRGFQLDSSAIGDAAKSVNLYRGDVNLPLHLVNLAGPHGLNVSLSAYYSSNVGQQVSTWNREAPTGILGLGWSLPFDHIVFEGNGTASWLEGQFVLTTGGNAHPLTLLAYTGTAANKDESLSLADPLNPLWQFTYTPADESWQVLRDDGVTMVFGDGSSGRDTVQWAVRWGNWAGNSAAASGSPQRFGRVWNLSSLTDQWGNQVRYTYQPDEQPVTDTLNYTRACYLQKILDGYGRSVIFSYKDKDPTEYQPPHTVDGKTPTAGYQDRYDTRYLSQIDVCPPGSDGTLVYYSLVPGYALHDLGGDPAVATTKRYLVSLAQQRNGQDVLPAMGFAYNLDSNTSGPGRLIQVTYPAGGQVNWTYTDVPLADPSEPANIFNLSYQADRPAGSSYTSAIPRLWFGSDYVIVGWYGGENLSLNIYSYGGRWSTPWTHELSGVNPQTTKSNPSAADKLDQIQVAMGSDFFALHFHNTGNTNDRLYIFQKTPYQFGQWSEQKETIDLGTSSVAVDETCLAAGNHFVALHVGGTSHLYRFRYNPVTQAWSADGAVSHNNGAKHIALAARENTLLACFFNGSSSLSGQSVIYYLKGDYSWGSYDQFNPTSSITWDSSYARSYWQWGTGFAVGTCLSESGSAHLQIIKWQRNFSDFAMSSKTVNNGSAYSQAAGSVIANGGNLLRYDGESWQEAQISWKSSDYLAVSDDTVLRVRKDGSYYSENVLATFDPVAGQWHTTTAFPQGDPPQVYAHAVGPQFRGDYLTLGNRVYYRGSGNDWQPVAHNSPLPHVYGGTVANLGPTFITYQNADNRDQPGNSATDSYAALLKNGDILKVADPFNGQKVQTTDGNAILCGANAFATYDADISDFSHGGHFILHRVLNNDIGPDQSACVVGKLGVETGNQTLATTYDYDSATAVFDPSGTVVQYPQVTVTHRDKSNQSLGSTVYHYANGLDPSQGLNLPSSDNIPADCYGLCAGYLLQQSALDDADTELSSTSNTWTGVDLTTKAEGGFTSLSGIILARKSSSTQTSYQLDVLDGSGTRQASDGRYSLTETSQYLKQTGQIYQKQFVTYEADGKQHTRSAQITYAWQQYPALEPGNATAQINAQTQVTFIKDGQPALSTVTTFGQVGNGNAWASFKDWQWTGSSQTAKKNSIPVFNFAKEDKTDSINQDSNNPGWQWNSLVKSRNTTGQVRQISNSLQRPASRLFDRNDHWPIAHFVNATPEEANFTSFESYEPDSLWSGGTVSSGDAHTGKACAYLKKGQDLICSSLTTTAQHTRYLLACFVKSTAGTSGALSLQVGNNKAETVSFKATANWEYVAVYADSANAGNTLKAKIDNNGSATLLVDDVQLAPAAADISTVVYNDLMLPSAHVKGDGGTGQIVYDALLRPLAHTGLDQQMASYRGLGYARGGLDSQENVWNTKLTMVPLDGGVFDDFRDPDWTGRWTLDNAAAWSIKNQVLTHSGKSRNTATLTEGTVNGNYSDYTYAVHVQVSQGGLAGQADSAGGSFGIKIGSKLTVQWNQTKLQWQMLDSSNAVIAFTGAVDTLDGSSSPTLPINLLLVANPQGVCFFVNQQLTLSHTFSSAVTVKGKLKLFTDHDGMGFSLIQLFLTPLSHLAFLDGTKRSLQIQQLDNDQITVAHKFYDERGRAIVNTKPIIYTAKVYGYQAGFANDPSTGTDWQMAKCDLTKAYPDDGGYPYWRNRYENSDLNRLLESGQPGADYAIASNTGHTTLYSYATNAANPFFGTSETPANAYNLTKITDPDQLVGVKFSDLLGNHVGMCHSGPGGGTNQSSTRYDACDNPLSVIPPNSYRPPGGSQSTDWHQTRAYNSFGGMTQRKTLDEGTTQALYDNVGNLRFKLNADGAAQSAVNPCSSGQLAVLYWKYDGLNRVIETGYTCQATWDGLQSLVNQPSEPAAGSWRYRYTYDGDNTNPNGRGKLIQAKTQHPDGSLVTEAYGYNRLGQMTAKSTKLTGENAFSGTVNFQYNHAGKLTATTLPSLSGDKDLDITRTYNARGLLDRIQIGETVLAKYFWTAAGQIQQEVMGDGIVTRTYAYTSSEKLHAIQQTSNIKGASAFSQTFYYEESGSPGTPRYNGLPSAMTYTSPGVTDVTWTLTWDDQKRLKTVQSSDGKNESYTYDANGNVTAYNGSTFNYIKGSNQLSSVGKGGTAFSYLPSGKLAATETCRFTYDFVSGVVTGVDVTGSNAGSLAAGCGNSTQRLVKTWTVAGKTKSTRLYLPGGNDRAVVEKLTTAGADATELRYISGPSGLIAIESSESGLLYVVRDQNNSIRLLLNASSSETGALEYSPFGSTAASGDDAESVPYHYTGQEEDKETGLYNYRSRLYDPSTLRFISPDPLNQYASPYVYVGNNPIQYNDPSGNFNWHEFADIATIVVLTANPITGPAALIGAAVAGIGYGINMATSHKKFDSTHFLDAIAGGEVGAVEIEAGVALDVLTDGAATDLGSNVLIGAGFSGLAYSTMAGNDYNWADFGATEAAGAVTGLISGGFGMVGDAAFGATESSALGWTARLGLRFAGGFLGSATGQAASLGIQGDSGSEIWQKMTSPASIEGDVITGTFAAGAAGIQRLADGSNESFNSYLTEMNNDEECQQGWGKKFLGELKQKGVIKASDTSKLNIPAFLGKKTFQGVGQISKKFVWAYFAKNNTNVKSQEW